MANFPIVIVHSEVSERKRMKGVCFSASQSVMAEATSSYGGSSQQRKDTFVRDLRLESTHKVSLAPQS